MATKVAVNNENAPDFRTMFNWGVKVSNINELFLIAGHGAHGPDYQVRHPGDPVAQTQYILADLKSFLERNGYSLDDIIRIEFTLTKDVDRAKYNEIFGLFAEFFANVAVKPAAGTLRVVDSLALPGMLVEYEFLAAK
jgi:enamine deaminase RidA (YjgF/YER057c/UK114 family)